MFIWTISDLIGAVALGIILVVFAGFYVAIKIQDWQLDRKRKLILQRKASALPDDR